MSIPCPGPYRTTRNKKPRFPGAFCTASHLVRSLIGGGGGSRTPVRRLFTPGYYVRFRSFGSRPQGPRPAGFPSDHPGLNFALPPPGRGIRAIPLGRRPSAYTGNRRLDVRGYLGRVSVAIVVGDYWFPLFTRSAGPRHATREHRRPRRNRFAPVTRRYHLSPEG